MYTDDEYKLSNLYNSSPTYNFWTNNQNLYCHLLLIEAENEINRPQSIMTSLKTN